MSDKKHIDRLFQERFKDFEAIPDDAVWNTIHDTLHGKKKKRRLIPIWWRVGGIAAGLVFLFSVGSLFLKSEDATVPQSTTTIVNEDPEKNTESNTLDSNNTASEKNNSVVNSSESLKNSEKKLTNDNNSVVTSNANDEFSKKASNIKEPVNANTTNSVVINNPIQTTNKENSIAQTAKIQNKSHRINPLKEKDPNKKALANNTIGHKKKIVASNLSNTIDKSKTDELIKKAQQNASKGVVKLDDEQKNKIDSVAVQTQKVLEEKPSIFNELDKEEDKVADKDKPNKRWNVMPNIAPVYFNTLGQGSSIHSQFKDNDKSGQVNMSYGIAASYALTNKLSLRSGINKVNVGYNTNDVIVFNGLDTAIGGTGRSIETIDYNNNTQTISVVTAANTSFSQVPDVVSNAVDSSLDQSLGFVEIPLELSYKISDKKLGVSIIGGMSALFLSDNEISSNLNGNRTVLGEANNVRNTSFSANFGLGMDYKLSEKFNINLEPVFKYQMNTFESKSGDFKPYLIGVYTGFSFKF